MAHPLAEMFQKEPAKLVLAIIWKLREHLPQLEVVITADDLGDLNKCIEAFGGDPQVTIMGRPDSIIVWLMDMETATRLRTIPLLHENGPVAMRMKRSMAARERAPVVIAQLRKVDWLDPRVAEALDLLEALV